MEKDEAKRDVSSNEDESKQISGETSPKVEIEQEQVPKKSGPSFAELNIRTDAVETKLHAMGDKMKVNTRKMMKEYFEKKESNPVWLGNEVIASAISRVRKLDISETSDLDESIGLKASKVPKLEPNSDPIASTSQCTPPDIQTPLGETSFGLHDTTMTSIPVWEARQFKERQYDTSDITSSISSRNTWASSELTLTFDEQIPSPLEEMSTADDDEQVSISDEQRSNTENLTSAFKNLTCNTELKSSEPDSKTENSSQAFPRDIPTPYPYPDISGIEPIFEDFSSFSDSSSDNVEVLVDDLIESAMSSSLDSVGGQRFVHSTPVRQTIERRVAQLERQLLETDDDSFSSFEDADVW